MVAEHWARADVRLTGDWQIVGSKRKGQALALRFWLFALASISLSALAQLSMKIGMTAIRGSGLQGIDLATRVALSPYVVGGLALYGVGAVLWLVVLSQAPLSLAYPLISIGFVLVAMLSWTVLGEPIPLSRLIGIAIIVVGVVVVGRR